MNEFFFLWRCGPTRYMASPLFRLLDHTQRRTTLLWTTDRLVAETSTKQHTTLKRDKHPWRRWDKNLPSQQMSGHRTTP